MINHARARLQGMSQRLLPIAEIVTRPVKTQSHRHPTWLLDATWSRLACHRMSSDEHVVEAEELYEVHKVTRRYLRLLRYRLQSIRLDNDRRTKFTALYADAM